MKVSVIVPAYNYARFLPDLFQCLINQSHKEWECIIIDNGSADETGVISKNQAQVDNRFIYLKVDPCFPSVARNKGLEISSGEFIQFLDADDTIGPDKFKTQLALFKQNERVDIVYGNYLLTDPDLSNHIIPVKNLYLSKNPFNDFVRRWEKNLTIPIHSFLIKKECFDKWGSMDGTLRTHEDWELQLKFSVHNAKYLFHNDVVAYYRIHQLSSSRNDMTTNRKDTLQVLNKYFHSGIVSNSQKCLILLRYIEFSNDIVLDKIRFNNLSLRRTLNWTKKPVLTTFTLFLFPFYLVVKTIEKVFGK